MGRRKERYFKKKSGALFQKKRIPRKNQLLFTTKVCDDNLTQEQKFEANSWIPIKEKSEADDNLEISDIGDRLSISDGGKTLLEDLKPSLDTLQESLSSARLKLSECNFEYICRLCGTELSEEECALSDNDVFCYNYAEKISSCTSLEVVPGDGLPHKMCIKCITNLSMAYDFRIVCIDTCNILILSSFNRGLETNLTDSKVQSIGKTHVKTLTTGNTHHSTQSEIEAKHNSLGSDEIVIQSKINSDTSFGNDENWTGVPFEKKETEQVKLDLSSSNMQRKIETATKDIVIYRCPKPTSNDKDIDKTTGYPTEGETVGALGFCVAINKTETHSDIGSTHSDDGNWWEDQLEERETKKTIFMLSYPLNTKKNINIAKKEIQKVCCPKLKCSDMEVLCPFCPAMFDAELYYEIQEHLDSHIRTKQVNVCRYENCNETFPSYVARNIHQLTDHGTQKLVPRKWLCEHSAMMVRPGCDCRRHIERRKDKPKKVYFCDSCSYRTDHRLRFSQHIEGLHNSKAIRCKLCDKMVPLDKLQYHITNKHEAKIPCKYCNKEFLRRNINGHLRTHTGEKPFSCSNCGIEFTFRVSLKNHRKRHHGDDMFKGSTEL